MTGTKNKTKKNHGKKTASLKTVKLSVKDIGSLFCIGKDRNRNITDAVSNKETIGSDYLLAPMIAYCARRVLEDISRHLCCCCTTFDSGTLRNLGYILFKVHESTAASLGCADSCHTASSQDPETGKSSAGYFPVNFTSADAFVAMLAKKYIFPVFARHMDDISSEIMTSSDASDHIMSVYTIDNCSMSPSDEKVCRSETGKDSRQALVSALSSGCGSWQSVCDIGGNSHTATGDIIQGILSYVSSVASDDRLAKCSGYKAMDTMVRAAKLMSLDDSDVRIYLMKCMLNDAGEFGDEMAGLFNIYGRMHGLHIGGDRKVKNVHGEVFRHVYKCVFGTYPASVVESMHRLVNAGLMRDDYGYDECSLHLILCGQLDKLMRSGYDAMDTSDALGISSFSDRIPGVTVFLSMLRNRRSAKRMHILLYGVPGSGKTELVRSAARDLGINVLNVNQYAPGVRNSDSECPSVMDSSSDSSSYGPSVRIGYASRANMMNRDGECGDVILIDEADTILQSAEKGYLNIFMDSVHTPVIWIANNIRCDDSTLRRFDYSIKFPVPGKTERAGIWRSVLKKQDSAGLLDDESIMEIAGKYNVTAGYMENAVRVAKIISSGGQDACKAVRNALDAQCELTGNSQNTDGNPVPAGYDPAIVRIDGDTGVVESSVRGFAAAWKKMKRDDPPKSLNLMFYGPPGTGKTAYAAYLSRLIERPIIVKACSDLVDCFVGNTEKNIRDAFDEAERTGSVLFFDEADSFFADRGGASHSWEVTQVNELLMRMEHFKGIFIAATNFSDNFDGAANRRFALKLKFEFLDRNGVARMWNIAFPSYGECPESVLSMDCLAPGDFSAVRRGIEFAIDGSVTSEQLAEAIRKESSMKKRGNERKMGF